MGAELIAVRVSFRSIRKCEFSGISHNDIYMGDSAKVALLKEPSLPLSREKVEQCAVISGLCRRGEG